MSTATVVDNEKWYYCFLWKGEKEIRENARTTQTSDNVQQNPDWNDNSISNPGCTDQVVALQKNGKVWTWDII